MNYENIDKVCCEMFRDHQQTLLTLGHTYEDSTLIAFRQACRTRARMVQDYLMAPTMTTNDNVKKTTNDIMERIEENEPRFHRYRQ